LGRALRVACFGSVLLALTWLVAAVAALGPGHITSASPPGHLLPGLEMVEAGVALLAYLLVVCSAGRGLGLRGAFAGLRFLLARHSLSVMALLLLWGTATTLIEYCYALPFRGEAGWPGLALGGVRVVGEGALAAVRIMNLATFTLLVLAASDER